MSPHDDYTLGLLLNAGLVTRSQIDDARSCPHDSATALQVLVQNGITSEIEISKTLARDMGMDWVDLSTVLIPPDIIGQIRAEDARRFNVIPLRIGENRLVVAIGDPLDIDAIDSLAFLLQRDIELICTSPFKIREALTNYYGTADHGSETDRPGDGTGSSLGIEIDADQRVSGDHVAEAPIVRIVSVILGEAHRLGASDIHIEPLDKKLRVRFRIDGVLQEMPAPPKRLQSAIISRLKIMTGSMSIAERRLPQDGRIRARINQKPIDLRVSTVPTNHGESIVMRVLSKSSLLLGLPDLGFLADDQRTVEQILHSPDGMLLITGPTGSGKTSTLYACLQHLNRPDRKIITVEEPIEYQMNGINQLQVNPEIGMTFPAALRAILRQAPNIIMIGEIRDLETASMAVSASLTGHLVFSTLHTNDAISAVARLVDIGMPPSLVASSIRAIVAQRLVRRLCFTCRQSVEMMGVGLDTPELESTSRSSVQLKPAGCDQCRKTGYKGRIGIFEILVVNDELRQMIIDGSSIATLREHLQNVGTRTLREDGTRKVAEGLTSFEEIISNTVANNMN